MDRVGTEIAKRFDRMGDQKVDVRLRGAANEPGKVVRMYAVDAREAIESGRGKLVGPPIRTDAQVMRRPELTEEDILEAMDRADDPTFDATHGAHEAPAPVVAGGRTTTDEGGPRPPQRGARPQRPPMPEPDMQS